MEETAQNFEKGFFINRWYIFIALPRFYVTHWIYEILSKSLVRNMHASGNLRRFYRHCTIVTLPAGYIWNLQNDDGRRYPGVDKFEQRIRWLMPIAGKYDPPFFRPWKCVHQKSLAKKDTWSSQNTRKVVKPLKNFFKCKGPGVLKFFFYRRNCRRPVNWCHWYPPPPLH